MIMRLFVVVAIACGLLGWMAFGSDPMAERVRSTVGEYVPDFLKSPKDYRSEIEEYRENLKKFRDAHTDAMNRARQTGK